MLFLENVSIDRYRKMTEQRDAKTHEAEMIMTCMQQSTHHQQLTELQKLKDVIGKAGRFGAVMCEAGNLWFNWLSSA